MTRSVIVSAVRTPVGKYGSVNVNGSSVALGSTGARMTATLVHEMRRQRIRYGAATLCGGGAKATR